jgi:hypothetical protein
MGARVIQAIETEITRGKGTNDDICRIVKQYYTPDGELLAEVDPFDNKKLYLDTIKRLEEELKVDEKLLDERNRLLKTIPGCIVHGNECIPGAIEWIAMAQHTGYLFEAALNFLEGLDGYEDWDREKWKQFFEDKIF